jgi:hypothetical protein
VETLNIYLAGPMRGYKDFNFPLFNLYAKNLRAGGHSVFNPAESDVTQWGVEDLKTATGDEGEVAKRLGYEGNTLARICFLKDTQYICKHADAVALMPGWEKSKGANAEKALAEALGLEVMFLGEIDRLV